MKVLYIDINIFLNLIFNEDLFIKESEYLKELPQY